MSFFALLLYWSWMNGQRNKAHQLVLRHQCSRVSEPSWQLLFWLHSRHLVSECSLNFFLWFCDLWTVTQTWQKISQPNFIVAVLKISLMSQHCIVPSVTPPHLSLQAVWDGWIIYWEYNFGYISFFHYGERDVHSQEEVENTGAISVFLAEDSGTFFFLVEFSLSLRTRRIAFSLA